MVKDAFDALHVSSPVSMEDSEAVNQVAAAEAASSEAAASSLNEGSPDRQELDSFDMPEPGDDNLHPDESGELQDQSLFRASSRGELEVVDVNFCGRAQRRLARHARRARIPLAGVNRALVVEEEFVDVEQEQVLEAEPEQLLSMDVSSDDGDALSVTQARVVPRPPRRRPGGAAASANSGRLVRLPARRRREQGREEPTTSLGAAATSVSDTFCHQRSDAAVQTAGRPSSSTESLPIAASERVEASWQPDAATRGADSWSSSTLTAAGFEGQPSASSSSPGSDDAGGREMPPILQVPLSPDLEESQEDMERVLPATWFRHEPEDEVAVTAPAAEAIDGQSLSSLYVEPVRPGMEPRHCRQCHERFQLGQLRLGYTPCGVAANLRPFLPVWVHAFACTRRARLAIGQDGEGISFSPAVSVADQNRLLEELRQCPRQRQGQFRQLCIRPWRYLPSVLQQWPVVRLQAQEQRSSQEDSSSQSSRPRWRLPSPPRNVPETPAVAVPEGLISDDEHAEADEQNADLGAQRAQEVLAQLLSGGMPLPMPPMPAPPHPPRLPPPILHFPGEHWPPQLPPLPAVPPLPGFRREADNEAAASLAAASARLLLAEVPTFKAVKKSEEPCVVCRDHINVGDVCRRLPCLHLFHKECIDQWLSVKATCPLDNLKLEDMLSKQRSIENPDAPESQSSRQTSRAGSRSRSRSRWDDSTTGSRSVFEHQGSSSSVGEASRGRRRFWDVGLHGSLDRHHNAAMHGHHQGGRGSGGQNPNWPMQARDSRWGVRPRAAEMPQAPSWQTVLSRNAATLGQPMQGAAPHSNQALRAAQSFYYGHMRAPMPSMAPVQVLPWSAPIMQAARPSFPPPPPNLPVVPGAPYRPAVPVALPVFPVTRDRSRSPPPARPP
eukprot:TRINITY_DN7061_c0_g1_i1.p1 TRINITY_DN7061_c0_g1~~TRINITY_DN7061_c0_g1_i1.p1  ORF type:complete len:895 (+),score=162.14 TRINITY_DN7061_c0_g1_i1:158-2842(+)